MRRTSILAAALVCAAVVATNTVSGQVRLIGITGNLGDQAPVGQNIGNVIDGVQQLALWEIDFADSAAATQLGTMILSPDSNAIGFNPDDGLLYRTGGGGSYRNGPEQMGYRDAHYMETIDPDDLLTPGTAIPPSTAIFNADGPNLPDDPPIREFGLPAPFPDWLLPAEPRTSTQTDNSFKEMRGVNEYHALRGLAWSASQNLFYCSDDEGIFTMTPDGQSTFIGRPREDLDDVKGIAFVNVNGEERLYVGTKEQTATGDIIASELIQVDPVTGLEIGSIPLLDPVVPTIGATGVLGLAVHPETGVLYGVTKGGNPDDAMVRELITINPLTGETSLIGEFGVNISSMAFVFDSVVPGVPGDTDGDQDVDLDDLNNVRNNFGGADPPIGDTDGDSDVDLDDLNAVRNNFGATSNPVPEPSTMVLALAGLAAVGYRFRRK